MVVLRCIFKVSFFRRQKNRWLSQREESIGTFLALLCGIFPNLTLKNRFIVTIKIGRYRYHTSSSEIINSSLRLPLCHSTLWQRCAKTCATMCICTTAVLKALLPASSRGITAASSNAPSASAADSTVLTVGRSRKDVVDGEARNSGSHCRHS